MGSMGCCWLFERGSVPSGGPQGPFPSSTGRCDAIAAVFESPLAQLFDQARAAVGLPALGENADDLLAQRSILRGARARLAAPFAPAVITAPLRRVSDYNRNDRLTSSESASAISRQPQAIAFVIARFLVQQYATPGLRNHASLCLSHVSYGNAVSINIHAVFVHVCVVVAKGLKRICKPSVVGSSPTTGSSFRCNPQSVIWTRTV